MSSTLKKKLDKIQRVGKRSQLSTAQGFKKAVQDAVAATSSPAKSSVSVSEQGAVPEDVQRSIIVDGFFQDFPWREVGYLQNEFYFAWPGAAGLSGLLDYPNIPGIVIDFTSIVFRAMIEVEPLVPGPPVIPAGYAFLRDSYLWGRAGQQIRVGSSDKMSVVGSWGGAPVDPGDNTVFTILNQDIAVPQVPFHLFLGETQHLWWNILLAANAQNLPVDYVGIELRGIYMAKAVYDDFRSRFVLERNA